MSDAMRKSIEELYEKLKVEEETVRKTKNAINTLSEAVGDEPPFGDLQTSQDRQLNVLRKDAFFGKPFATAVRMLLDLKKEPMEATAIVEGLKQGGFDFGKRRDPVHSVKTSLGKNTAYFIQIPNSDSFALVEWYDNVSGKKQTYRKRSDSNGAIENQQFDNRDEDLNDTPHGPTDETFENDTTGGSPSVYDQ